MAPKKPYPSHGILNDIQKPVVQDRFDLEDGTASGLVRRTIQRNYIPDAITNTGPYKAIVLRVDNENSKEPIAGSWLTGYLGKLFGNKILKFVHVKARVPELHSMLPIPNSLGLNSDDHAVIDMYPTFIAQDENTDIPEVGSLIWVDFGNKTNFTDPIYIKPVLNSKTNAESGGIVSAEEVHTAICGGEFNSEVPEGDTVRGNNIALSHSGKIILPRGRKKSILKENKVLRGNRCSSEIIDKWEESIKVNGFPGITWIGNISSNGIEVPKHNRGKRDTIIYSPNTTDFSVPIELMYFFHSSGGFNNSHDFRNRIALQISQLVKEKRNFVLIIPELPWSFDSNKDQFNDKDNFSRFDSTIRGILRTSFAGKIDIGYVSFVAHGEGGRAIKRIIDKGWASVIAPNKIVLAECDYYGVIEDVWQKYIKNNNKLELDILTRVRGQPFERVKRFLNKNNLKGDNSHVFAQYYKETHREIGDRALLFINEKAQEASDERFKKSVEEEKLKGKNIAHEENIALNVFNSIVEDILPVVPEDKQPMPPNNNRIPSAISKISTTRKPLPEDVIIKESEPFVEARVRLKEYGTVLLSDEKIVIDVPKEYSLGERKIKLHKLALKRFMSLNEAWMRENPGQPPIKIVSGLRKQRYKNYEEYEKRMVAEYGSVEKGRMFKAFSSPHQTGLAFDIGNNGLFPSSATILRQKKTRLYKWLVGNAYRFGITPYKVEPWHWEVRLPRESWSSGEEFTDNYAVLVVRTGKGRMLPSQLGKNTAVASRSERCVKTLGEVV